MAWMKYIPFSKPICQGQKVKAAPMCCLQTFSICHRFVVPHLFQVFATASIVCSFTCVCSMAADDMKTQLRAAMLFRLESYHGVVHDVDGGDSQEARLEADSGLAHTSSASSTATLASLFTPSGPSGQSGGKTETCSPEKTFKMFSPTPGTEGKDTIEPKGETEPPLLQPSASGQTDKMTAKEESQATEFCSTPEVEEPPSLKKPATKNDSETGLKRPASCKRDPPAKKAKQQLKRPAAATEAVETEAVEVEPQSEVSKAAAAAATTALEDAPCAPANSPAGAVAAGEDSEKTGMDDSMFPNAARSYKDTPGEWEAGVRVRAAERELERRTLEKNCSPSFQEGLPIFFKS
eukprot:s2323_g3.t1